MQLLVDKHQVGPGSITAVLCPQISAREIILEKTEHWITGIKSRLTPRIRGHNAWQIKLKQDMPIQLINLLLKAVRKARSLFGV